MPVSENKSSGKILIIRFSSFGDILAMMSVPAALKNKFPDAEIHWLTRSDFSELATASAGVDRVWPLNKKQGFFGLLQIIDQLRKQNFTHIYDAHNNLRSHLITWGLRGPWGLARWFGLAPFKQNFLRRPTYRLRRLMLFNFRVNWYPKPFVHQWALLEVLAKWDVSLDLPKAPLLSIPEKILQQAVVGLRPLRSNNKPVIALSPSASYQLKRWPVKHWQNLIRQNPQFNFITLGGPEDQFINEIVAVAPERCVNLAGKMSYLESSAYVAASDLLISNDTGLMHVAEQLGHPCIAFLGPAPFGYPGRATTYIKEKKLNCRPCSKHGQGPCVNPEYQKCLVDISVEEVTATANQILKGNTKK